MPIAAFYHKKAETMVKPSNEIVPAERLSKEELENFPVTPEEIRAYIESLGMDANETVFRASEYDLTDKAELVGVPLFIVQWQEKASPEFGGFYVVVHGIRLDTREKVVFADGSTGIAAQLIGVTDKREAEGKSGVILRSALSVPKGLVRSDYDAHQSPSGETVPAGTTYYLG